MKKILRHHRTILNSIKSFLILALFSFTGFSQTDFAEKSKKLKNDSDTELKKHLKEYRAFEFKVNDLKKLIRKKSGATTPIEFAIEFDSEKYQFTLFENNIISQDFINSLDAKSKEEFMEVNTFSGFVNGHPKNALRLYITENRISGFFNVENQQYIIGHVGDYSVFEKPIDSSKKLIYISKRDDEISLLVNDWCSTVLTSNKSARVSATQTCTYSPACKFVRLAVMYDQEFANQFASLVGYNLTGQTVLGAIADMVNRADYAYNNTYNASNGQQYANAEPLSIKLKLVHTGLVSYEFQGQGVVDRANRIYLPTIQKDVIHLISGRPLGSSSYGNGDPQFGWANSSSLCNSFLTANENPVGKPAQPISVSTINCNGYCLATTNGFIKYSDAYLTMAHEIGHVLGMGGHENLTPKSIMDSGENKSDYIATNTKNAIYNYLCNKSCLQNNIVDKSFSNRFFLTLNGNNITSTPMLINRNEKLVSIPKSTDPIFALKPNATTFSFSNPAVNVLYRDNYSTRFSLGAVNSFTLNVSTTDWCNYYYYWPVLFVYTTAGARISENHYPNPANDIITVETTILNEDEPTTISNIEVYDHVDAIQKNVKNQKDGEKYLINTSSLANGIYFIHITYSNGEVSKKRIIINHE